MRHKPRNELNPYLLDEAERTSAKIWELLRRNACFQKAVARLQKLDKRPSLDGRAMVNRLYTIHGFAGIAIQWLVPQPLFQIKHVTITALAGKETVSSVKIQQGITPDPNDGTWRTFRKRGKRDADSQANAAGPSLRRGPRVEVINCDDPRFCRNVEALQEWRDYFANGHKFSLATPWRDSPPQFKREFCSLWQGFDSRLKNPATGTRVGLPREHEPRFFYDWNLLSKIAAKSAGPDDLARALMLDELAKHHRVFAFPKSIRTRTEARRMANWLFEKLCQSPDGKQLPAHEQESFGTSLQWDVYLFAGKHNDGSLFEAYRQAKPDISRGPRRRKWRKESSNYLEHFRALERQIKEIFPRPVKTPPIKGK